MDWRDGQARTAWLNNALQRYVGDPVDYFLGPTGIPDRINALTQAAQYTDAGDFAEATDASRAVWNDPSLTNALRYATAAGAVAIPMVSARMMRDGVDVAGDAARSMGDDAGRFWVDEDGALTVAADPAVGRAGEVLDLLRQGRGAEVTDEMLDMGDPVLNARMNSHLWNNYDLPMDEASRMARADEMGFGPAVYHGTGQGGFSGFSSDASRISGVTYTDTDPSVASAYAKYGDTPQVYPVTMRADNPERFDLLTWDPTRESGVFDRARNDGFDAYYANDGRRVAFDPHNIRSRFARFDPRLAHLRNLSAGLGGAAVLNGAYGDGEEARQMRELLDYLNQ